MELIRVDSWDYLILLHDSWCFGVDLHSHYSHFSWPWLRLWPHLRRTAGSVLDQLVSSCVFCRDLRPVPLFVTRSSSSPQGHESWISPGVRSFNMFPVTFPGWFNLGVSIRPSSSGVFHGVFSVLLTPQIAKASWFERSTVLISGPTWAELNPLSPLWSHDPCGVPSSAAAFLPPPPPFSWRFPKWWKRWLAPACTTPFVHIV